MAQKDSKADIKKATPPSEWFKNVVKSIGYSSSEVVKSISPNIHNFVESNVEYGKEIADSVRESREQSQSIFEMMNLGTHANIAKSALSNALDDIKSGKIYNKERAEALDDDDEFGMFMTSMDNGDYDSNNTSTPTIINNTKVIKGDTPKLVASLEAAASANMKGTEAMLKQGAKVATTSMAMNHELSMGVTKGLQTVNENIGQLVNFQNDSMAKYVGASIKYYDESLTVMKNSLEKLSVMSPERQERRQKEDPYDTIFNGGGAFSLRGYVDNVKRNYEVMQNDNQIVQMVSSILSDDTSTLKRLADSPLTFISDTITKKVIPMTIRSTVEQVDKSFTSFLPAMLDKFSRMGKDGNIFTETFGRLLGVDTSVKSTPNMSGYMRGAIPFDGEAKRALTDIIPTYLRKIYSQLSGTKEIAFDYEEGKWSDVDTMKKAYEDARLSTARSGYSTQVSKLEEMMSAVKFESIKQQQDFQQGMNEFLHRLAKTSETVAFDTTTAKREALNREKTKEIYSFGNPKLDSLMFSMLGNLSKTDQMELVGSGRYEAIKEMREFIRSVEESPTKLNAMTLMGGLKHDQHIEVDEDGGIKKAKATSTGLNRVDLYGKDDLYYLRGIMNTLLEGIVVFNSDNKSSSTDGGQSTELINTAGRLAGFKSQTASQKKVTATELLTHDSTKANRDSEIVMGDIEIGDDIHDKLFTRLEHNRKMEEEQAKKSMFGGMFSSKDGKRSVQDVLDEVISKPSELLKKSFEKIDGTLYNLVFGIQGNGKGSFMHLTLDRMTEMFSKVGDFATEKIFLPTAEFVSKMYTKGADAVKENPIVQGIKDGVKFWFVGDKDENGKRQGGVLSELMNSTKDTVKSVSHSITGIGYTDSYGRSFEKKEDSVFGQMKGLVKDIFGETKKHFFGDKDNVDPDKRRGMMSVVTDTLGDGMSDWSSMLFGTQRDPNKTGSEILKQNTSQFVKAAPKGILGSLGGMAAGTALASGFGILGSFLFPGAPVALALAGGALGMATGFEGFNKWAFGEIGNNGERIGGALISANTKQFVKDNKSKLIGGAVGGVLASMALPAIADMVVPGAGTIVNMLSPFGPIGAAMQGMATAFILKSDTVMSWLFGAKNLNGERVGGMMTRLFKKTGDETAKRSVKSKLGLAAIGIAGGAVLSSMTGAGLSASLSGLGFLGTMIASPFGPVGGAIAGLAASLALGSEKVRTMLFGKKSDDESGIDDIGFIGRSLNVMKMEVFEPMKNTITGVLSHTTNWFKNKFMADVAFVTEPIIKGIQDTISGSFKLLRGAVWGIPKFLVKGTASIISKTVSGIQDALKDTVIEKAIIRPAGAIVKAGATMVVRPLRFFAETTLKAAVGLAKAGESIQNGFLMIPALMKMGFDRTFETTKSLFGGLGKMFKRTDEDGMSRSFGGRVKEWWQTGRREGKENSSYVDTLFSNRKEKREEYKREKERISSENKQRKDDWKLIVKASRGTNYNTDGLMSTMPMEDASIANALRMTSRRREIKDQEIISKLQVEVFKGTGLTLGQLLNTNPNKPVEHISNTQLKYVKMVLERSKKKGLRGDELKKDQKLIDYKMNELDLTEGTYDETKRMRQLMETLSKGFESIMDKNSLRISVENLSEKAKSAMSPSYITNYDEMISQYRNTGTSASQGANTFSGALNVINPGFQQARDKVSKEESSGGAIGGAITSATKNIASRVTNVMSGMTKEVSKLGCGAIVLSKVLAEAGVKMSANDIYKLAEERGLSNPGIGISSNVFKVVANLKGLSYQYLKPSKQNLGKMFAQSNMVIARLNTGVGHYVILHSYSSSDNSLAIDDPMGKVSGIYDVGRVIAMTSHLYAVYKRGQVSIFKSLKSNNKSTGESSFGGALSASAQNMIVAQKDNRVNDSNNLTDIIQNIGALPVVHFKSKKELELEEKMVKSMNGEFKENPDAEGVSGAPTSGRFANYLNTFSLVRTMSRIARGITNLVKGTIQGGKKIAGDVRNAGGIGDYGRQKGDAVKDGYNKKKAETWSTAAQGPLSLIGLGARTAVRIGRVAVSGTRRVIRGIINGPSNIGTKVSQDLVQMGDTASSGNIGGLNTGYNTAATPGFGKNGMLDVNNFLKQQSEKNAAQAESNFRGSTVDLSTRIEINTRHTAHLLAELLDGTNRFNDWLKDWLQNFDPCCGGGFGGGGFGGGGGGGLIVTPPIITNRTTNNKGGDKTTTTTPITNISNGGDTKNIVTTVPVVAPIPLPRVIGRTGKTTGKTVPTTTTRGGYNTRQLPLPQTQGLPQPAKTRRVKDAMTGQYRDMDIRDDVIDMRNVRDPKGSLPVPKDVTRTGTSKPISLPLPQGKTIPTVGRVPEPELVPAGGYKQQHTRTAQAPHTSSVPRTPTIIDADFTEVVSGKDVGQAKTPNASASNSKAGTSNYEKLLSQSKEEFIDHRRSSIQRIDEFGEDEIRRDFRNGKISSDEYNKRMTEHTSKIEKQYASFDADTDKAYGNIQKEKEKYDKKNAKKQKKVKTSTSNVDDAVRDFYNRTQDVGSQFDDLNNRAGSMNPDGSRGTKGGTVVNQPSNSKPYSSGRRGSSNNTSDAVQDYLNRTQSIGSQFDDLDQRARVESSGGKVKKGGRTKQFLSGVKNLFSGKQTHGIAAGIDTMDDLGRMGRNAGKSVLNAGKSVGSKVTGLFGSKAGTAVAKKGLKSGLKSGAKIALGVGTAGLATALFAGMDYKYGKENANDIYNTDAELNAKQQKAAGLSSAAVGAIPFADLIDETVFKGKMKEVVAKTIEGFMSGFGKVTDWVKEGWDTLKTSVTSKLTEISESTKEKFNGIKESIGQKWDETKTGISDKLTEVIQSAKDKWGSIKESISTKWDETKTAISDTVTGILASVKEKWGAIKTTISTKFDETKKAITEKINGIISDAKAKWDSVKLAISTKWNELKTGVTTKISGIITDTKTKWEGIKTAVSTKWDDIKTAIPKKITEIKEDIVSKLGGIVVSFKGLATDIGSKVKEKILGGLGSLKVKIFGNGESVSIKGEKEKESTTKTSTKTKTSTHGHMAMGEGKNAVDKLMENSDEVYGAGAGCGTCAKSKTRKKNTAKFGAGSIKPIDSQDRLVKDSNGEVVEGTGIYANGGTRGRGPVSSGGSVEGAYYSQKDSRWSGNLVAGSTSFGDAGCGPTAIANVVTDLTGQKVLPTEALSFAQNKGLVDPELGTNSDLFGQFAGAKGVNINETIASTDTIMNQLQSGNKLILRGENGSNYTKSGHYIIADGLTDDGKVRIKDPLGKERSGEFSIDQVAQGLTNAFVASGGSKTFANGIGGFGKATFAKGGTAEDFITEGRRYLGLRYRFGGKSLTDGRGIDCSGYTKAIVKKVTGIDIGDGSINQWNNKNTLVDVAPEDVCVGDLVFFNKTFSGRGNNPTHVAFISGDNKMLEAGGGDSNGSVRFNDFNTSYWTPKIMGYRRVKGVTPGKKVNVPSNINTSRNKTLAGAIAGTAGVAAMAANWSMSNLSSAFDIDKLYPSAITNLPNLMESLSNTVLFGAPTAGIAAAISGLTGSSGATSSVTGNSNTEKIWNYFRDLGFSKQATAGIMGNLQQESNLDPAKLQAPPGKAKGLAQWEGGRWTNLVSKANKAGVSEWDLGIQLKHIMDELNGEDSTTKKILGTHGGLDALKNATDYKQAAMIFEKSFERAGKPVMEKRYQYAKDIYDNYSVNGKGGTYGAGTIADYDRVENSNIYKIMKSTENTSIGAGTNDKIKASTNKLFAKGGCGCSGKGGDCGCAKTPSPSSRNTPIKTSANGLGSMERIGTENAKMQEFSVRESAHNHNATAQVNNIFGAGSTDAWSKENVERAIQALETIAGNTEGVKESIGNVAIFNDNSSSANVSPVKSPSSTPERKIDQNQVQRNKNILTLRK